MALNDENDELIAIRLELKGQREAISGIKSVDKAQQGLGTSTTKAGTAAEKAEKKTSRLSRAYASLGRTAKLGLGFLGVGGIFAIKNAVDATEDLALATSGLTRNFGFNTNVASRWAAVMHGRSVEPKALTMAFATLSSKMTETARKGGTLLTPFHQLGITQDEVARGAKDFEWGVLRVAKALGEEEGGARRSTAAKALLGKGFQTLTPLFSEGVEGLKEQLHWADKYGVTLSTTTKDGLMGMVVAQRETKVATLGLQIAMTKALMPAIEAGQNELHKFIAVLNDDDLSADQKMRRIERQFLRIEDTLIDVITDALPKVAEHGGELGVKLIGSVWHGFKESDTLGKLFIGFWLFKAMGGFGLVGTLGARYGAKLATSMGWRFLTVLAPYFAAEAGVEGIGSALGSRMGGLKTMFGRAGTTLGRVMGTTWGKAFMVTAIVFGLAPLAERIQDQLGLDDENSNLLETLTGKDVGGPVRDALGMEPDKKFGDVHVPKSVGGGGRPRGGDRPPKGGQRRGLMETPTLPRLNLGSLGGSGRPLVVHTHVHLDGKEIAENTTRHVLAAEALA